MDLRTATKASHEAAERSRWSQLMISGDMTIPQYAAHLTNMLPLYQELERSGDIDNPAVLRADLLRADLAALDTAPRGQALSTIYYTRYLSELTAAQRWAHIYVHYLGNMYGGQMIARRLPGPAAHLEFDDTKACIAWVRERLQSVDPAEANFAFAWTQRVYDELHLLFG